ncbi:MAG: NAD-dependent epimerase/dehydratase family protein [Nitrospiraceae bacterium]|nr:NAD-dependent epimerase/dehydratase family protein [Nitrospiraceae bacterium]
MKILITGANGFIGRRVCQIFAEKGHFVRAAVRNNSFVHLNANIDVVHASDIDFSNAWKSVLTGVDVIVHLAARTHVMNETSKYPLAEYRKVNVEGTRRLASMAVQAGVRRIVYVSTIKVNGESTGERAFREYDIPSPQDPYAISKWESEEVLRDFSVRHGLEVVIIRPPLVYGPGVKGNLLKLMKYIYHRYPIPFGGIQNRRSFISLDNLVDVLILSATNAVCNGHTFLVSDGEDISTTALVSKIAEAMDIKTNLIKFPYKTISLITKVFPSLQYISDRLTSSLAVDNSKFKRMFDWIPPQTIQDGIKAMVACYTEGRGCNVS